MIYSFKGERRGVRKKGYLEVGALGASSEFKTHSSATAMTTSVAIYYYYFVLAMRKKDRDHLKLFRLWGNVSPWVFSLVNTNGIFSNVARPPLRITKPIGAFPNVYFGDFRIVSY